MEMETTVLKSGPPGAEQTPVEEDKVSSFHIKIHDSFRNHSNHTLSIFSFLLPYNDKTSFPLTCNDCELSQAP